MSKLAIPRYSRSAGGVSSAISDGKNECKPDYWFVEDNNSFGRPASWGNLLDSFAKNPKNPADEELLKAKPEVISLYASNNSVTPLVNGKDYMQKPIDEPNLVKER